MSDINLGGGGILAPPPGDAGGAGGACGAVGAGGPAGAGTGGPGAGSSGLGAADAGANTFGGVSRRGLWTPQEVFQFLQRHYVPLLCQLVSAYTDSPITVSSELFDIASNATRPEAIPIPHWFRVQTERIKRCNSQAKKDY
ncbi:BQ5605_C029g10634 [Microbotryum silenes-dioicae]|uniref:BQ5605_C029g10634 protein n=1 Tax=Microbotryum silenes-dioicae TaxID=796604 RepID=A0A2X0PD70_9BASI|nr:BQ5605_C029g10634 [Microbotryum silenes-dioicae]